GYLLGGGLDDAQLGKALSLEAPGAGITVELAPSFIGGLLMIWTGRPRRARALLGGLRERLLDRGEAGHLPVVGFHLTWAEFVLGNLDGAAAAAHESHEIAIQIGGHAPLALGFAARALVAGWQGEVIVARADAELSLEHADAA